MRCEHQDRHATIGLGVERLHQPGSDRGEDTGAGPADEKESKLTATYSELSNQVISAANGIEYTYREIGSGGTLPLVLLQHFRGNLDNWDPALIDALASSRRVVTFDNVGVGATTGSTPSTVEDMARGAIEFMTAMKFEHVDLLGFSIGSFVAQEVVLSRPAIARRLILASSAPKGAAGMHGWDPDVIGAIGTPNTAPDEYLRTFFTASSPTSKAAGQQAMGRIFGRHAHPDAPTTWQTRQAQYDAVCSWGVPSHALLERMRAIEPPVFIAAGDGDRMILPHYSYLLAGLIPAATVKIYSDSAHGFLFQHSTEFGADVRTFLDIKE
jgi:pimeloyl-ACP methyl ester carboxylesterase